MVNLNNVDDVIKLFGFSGAIIGVFITIATYYKSKRMDKIGELIQMHARFINNEDFFEVRYKIDRWDKKLFESIEYDKLNPDNDKVDKKDEAKHVDIELMGKFNDYLEFFLLLTNLWKMKLFSKQEIDNIFGYYLRQITEDKTIWAYINVPTYKFKDIGKLAQKLNYDVPN